MPNGTVKFFNAQKGFGFITPDDGSKDVFLAATAIAASGITALKPGLRVAFETQPDGKGPKAVALKQIAAAHSPQADRQRPPPDQTQPRTSRLTVYLDPASELASDAIAELRDAGLEPQLVDYIANPPAADELKALSLLLRESDQSLVRKFDPLFSELRLDDRFIGDSEFWAAIHEHPSLINGPILTTATTARVCRTESAVEAFVAAITVGDRGAPPKPKALPESLARLLMGGKAPPAAVEKEAVAEKPAPIVMPKTLDAEISGNAEVKPKASTKGSAKAKIAPRLASKIKAGPKLKVAAKTEQAAKPAKKKPVKKAPRK